MRCATHPEVETGLRCGRCGRLICPKCLVQTPVGARCADCAKLKRLPTYAISPRQYLIASGAGLGVAIITGFAWAFIPLGGYFSLLIALGVGYVIGEVISRSVNRKRGRGLQAIGGASMVVRIFSFNSNRGRKLGEGNWNEVRGLQEKGKGSYYSWDTNIGYLTRRFQSDEQKTARR